jgi:hypothetical protein
VSGAGPAYTDGNATSVIDVEAEPSRTQFVNELNGDTTLITSAAALLVDEFVNNVNYGIDLDFAEFDIVLTGNQTPITDVDLEATVFTEVDQTWILSSTFALNNLRVPDANDVLITVDGTSVLTVGEFSVDLTILPAEAGVGSQQLLTSELAFDWSINAMQCKIPYMALNFSGFNSFIKIDVEGNTAADLSVDAVIYNTTDDITTTQSAVPIRTLAGPSLETVGEADLMTALGLDTEKSYHVALTLTVVAPQNTVNVSAFQKDSVGRTTIPVLYNTNNPTDGRKWQ